MKKTNKKQTFNELSNLDKLFGLIKEVNKLPFSYDFLPLDPDGKREGVEVLFAAHKSNPTTHYGQNIVLNWVNEQRQQINREISHLPKTFQRYIWKTNLNEAEIVEKLSKELWQFGFYQGFFEQFDLSNNVLDAWTEVILAVLKYERFHRLREQFQFIMRLAYRVHYKIPDTDFVQGIKQAYSNKYANSLSYEINVKGVLTVVTDEFSQAINGKKVSLIRECRKCQKIFWGVNTRSQYCGAECRQNIGSYHATKSRNHRKADKNYEYNREEKHKANERAKKLLEEFGFNANDLAAYNKKYRKVPHRVIYDYLMDEVLKPETRKSVEQIKIPHNITQTLRNFIEQRRAQK